VLNNLGALSEDIGDYATAEGYYQQSYHLHQQQGEPLNIAIAALNLGEVARQQGHWQQANHHYQESFRLAEPLQYQVLLSTLYLRLAVLALQAQNFSQAIQYLQTGLPLLLDFKVWNDLPLALKTLAEVSLALEQAEWACQALAIAEPLYRPLASAGPPANLAQRKQQLRQQLGAKTFQQIWQTSQSTPPEKFIRQLLPHLSHSPQAAKKALPPLANLTRREADVARLVARGLTNQEIASELTIVIKTVEKHLANVMSKLNCRNRAEVAAKMAASKLNSTPR
jgi:non-specific serine/threonine protein kinase